MIEDTRLDAMLEAPNVNDVVRLVVEVRRQRREIAHLRGTVEKVAAAAIEGHGPYWIEELARESLKKDFRIG